MVGVARVAAANMLGIDCYEPIPDAVLRSAAAKGFAFVGRYLETLTVDERDRIFDMGRAILLVTAARTDKPLSGATGVESGDQALASLLGLQVPPSVHVTIDLESPPAGSNVAAHVNAFSLALTDASFGAMLYVGQPQPFTSGELYALAPTRYWKAAGRCVDAAGELAEPLSGWCALQLSPLEQDLFGFGFKVDVDVLQADDFGRRAILWWPS